MTETTTIHIIDPGSNEFFWRFTDALNEKPAVRRAVQQYADAETFAEQDAAIDALYDIVLSYRQVGEWLRLTCEEAKYERGSILWQNEQEQEAYITINEDGISSW